MSMSGYRQDSTGLSSSGRSIVRICGASGYCLVHRSTLTALISVLAIQFRLCFYSECVGERSRVVFIDGVNLGDSFPPVIDTFAPLPQNYESMQTFTDTSGSIRITFPGGPVTMIADIQSTSDPSFSLLLPI